MDLILWRHAQAHDALPGGDDFSRTLTRKGQGQARRVAVWLDRQIPDSTRVLVSPALRAEQTAKTLGRKYKLRNELLPGSSADELLALLKWANDTATPNKGSFLLVGHQPTLGCLASRLLGTAESVCDMRKGSVWWLRSLHRQGPLHMTLVAVVGPDTI